MINLSLTESYILKSKNKWKSQKNWQPFIISIVIIISIAIIHKGYWESTTETNPEDIWGNKQVTKDGNNWTITFEEDIGDTITFKGILRTAPKFEVYANDTFVPGKYSEGEALDNGMPIKRWDGQLQRGLTINEIESVNSFFLKS